MQADFEHADSQHEDADEQIDPSRTASDSREAEYGARYVPSGQLGTWWIASIGAIAIGMVAGFGSSLLAAPMVGGVTRMSAVVKGIGLALCVGAAVAIVATAFLAKLAKVRSDGFVYLLGLGAGLAFAYGGVCGAAQCFALVPAAGSTGFISGWWGMVCDTSVLWTNLQAAFPAGWQLWVLFGIAAVSAVVISVGANLVCAKFTHGFLFDEANGAWFGRPTLIARTQPEQLPRLLLIPSTQLSDVAVLRESLAKPAPDSVNEWLDVFLHPSRTPGEMSLVRFRPASVEVKQTFLMKKKRATDYENIGSAFFFPTDEVERLREDVRLLEEEIAEEALAEAEGGEIGKRK
jgi:hypothetical protein